MLSFLNEEAGAQIVDKIITNARGLCGSKFETGTRLSHRTPFNIN